MIRVEALTLEDAYSKAAKELSCSVVELDLKVIQYPKSGFLGVFKKIAIVEARKIGEQKREIPKVALPKPELAVQDVKPKLETQTIKKNANSRRKDRRDRQRDLKKELQKQDEQINKKVEEKKEFLPNSSFKEKREVKERSTVTIFDEKLHEEKVDINSVIGEISKSVNTLFSSICFDITNIKVSAFAKDTVLIEFDGDDSALLIGKEGHRYKAISYMLYNWINIRYGFGIRLEISEFLKNQEEMMEKYLVSIVERVKNNGRAQTKILDGVLIKIALEKLRFNFPDKYVAIKSNREGDRFIVVNDFNRKNQ